MRFAEGLEYAALLFQGGIDDWDLLEVGLKEFLQKRFVTKGE